MFSSRKSFTLIELLMVLAIVAILSVVVILTLNPAEFLKEARDSTRLSDLSTLNTALAAYNTDVVGGFMGTSSVVYVSVPDTSPACANLGLPTLPSGWSYSCSTSANLKKTDGTGWIPVNFAQITFGSALSNLPVDPINSTTTRNYYTYVTGGSWELSAIFEAAKNKLGGAEDRASTDGGSYAGVYEIGTNLTLIPIDTEDSALMGYWKFNEGSGTVATDVSGHGAYGTLTGNASWTTGISGYAINLDGSAGAFVNTSSTPFNFKGTDPFTLYAFVNRTNNGAANHIMGKRSGCGAGTLQYELAYNNDTTLAFYEWDSNLKAMNGTIPSTSGWVQVVFTYDGSVGKIYFNGSLVSSSPLSFVNNSVSSNFIIGNSGTCNSITGKIDEVRVYSRALSVAEIQALYNATK